MPRKRELRWTNSVRRSKKSKAARKYFARKTYEDYINSQKQDQAKTAENGQSSDSDVDNDNSSETESVTVCVIVEEQPETQDVSKECCEQLDNSPNTTNTNTKANERSCSAYAMKPALQETIKLTAEHARICPGSLSIHTKESQSYSNNGILLKSPVLLFWLTCSACKKVFNLPSHICINRDQKAREVDNLDS